MNTPKAPKCACGNPSTQIVYRGGKYFYVCDSHAVEQRLG